MILFVFYHRMRSVGSFGSTETAFLQLEVNSIPPEGGGIYNARTYSMINRTKGYYRIRLDSDFVNTASTIEIAFTLLHELVHAELLERCRKLNLVEFASSSGVVKFHDSPTLFTTNEAIFSALIQHYYNYGTNSEWNHDLMNVFNFRNKIIQDLILIHPILDPNNTFAASLNNTPVSSVNSTAQAFDLLSWAGLEGTQEYLSLPPNKKNEIAIFENFIHTNYTQICN